MKHVNVQLHLIWAHVDKGIINVEYCPTDDMLADLMMKGLPCKRHERLLGLMGVGLCEKTTRPSRVRCRRMEIMSGSEEFRNFQGNAGVGSSYISYSTRDVIKAALYQLQG